MPFASRRPVLSRLGLLFGGGVLGLLLTENVVRFTMPQIFDVHPPELYVEDPDVGYVLAPGFEAELTRAEFSVAVSTGLAGLRGADPRPREANSVRVLALGDSLVWGFGVADDETFAAQLEGLLAERYPELDVQVLNGGVPGYGTADALNFLRSRGEALEPDVVLPVFLPVNDFEENRIPARDWARIRDGMLVGPAINDDIIDRPVPMRIKGWLKERSHLARLLADTLGYIAMRGGLTEHLSSLWKAGEDFTEEDRARADSLLREMANHSRALGGEALLVYATGQDRVLAADYDVAPSAELVAAAAAASDVPWIDVTPALRANPEPAGLFYPRDGHWTRAGHRAIAQILFEELTRLDLVAPR